MDALFRNAVQAFRVFARSPSFTLTVIATLALGIGATTAVFAAIDAVLLRPLSFPNADQLMRIGHAHVTSGDTNVAPQRLEDWKRLDSSFHGITGYYSEDVSDTSGDLPEKVRRAMVAARFLEVWGVAPALGPGFTETDYANGRSVLISDRYWRRRFGGNPDALRQPVQMGGQSFAVVGVMPPSFEFPDRDVDIWLPVTIRPSVMPRNATWYTVIGRLKPGVSRAEAEANLRVIQSQLAAEFPDTDRDLMVNVQPLKDTMVAGAKGSLWLLLGAVTVLLLIACTNIASLLLARAAQREQEIAIRFSLGASRGNVAVQILTETALLALAGSVLGILVAGAVIATFKTMAPDLPRIEEFVISWRVVSFSIVCALAVALFCALFPAIRSMRMGRPAARSERTQLSTRSSLQWMLVAVQVALSLTLLVSAGLLLRSFDRLSRTEVGFERNGVLTFQISAGWGETRNYDALVQRINTTLDTLKSLPQVEATATTNYLPGIGAQSQSEFEFTSESAGAGVKVVAENRVVSPSYFEALQIPLLSGELCSRPVNAKARSEGLDLLVNRSFIDAYVPGRSGLGLYLSGGYGTQPGRIVGVVADAREAGIDRVPPPTVYACFTAPNPMPMFIVKSTGDMATLVEGIRRAVKEQAPLRSVHDVLPLERRISDTFAQDRLRTVLLTAFAAAALALACLGVYGTLSYAVTLRQREVGLMLALGALRGKIVKKFVGEAVFVVGIGCLVGLVLLLGVQRVLSGMLFGVSAADPATIVLAVGLVILVAVLAAARPAVRAAFTDPMRTLREE